jgi:predicted acetyltransferase
MERQLHDVRERGEPVAVLWASEGAIYQRFGYGMGTMDGSFEVDTARTKYARPQPPDGRVRVVDEEESAALFPGIYEAMRVRTPAALSRTDAWWTDGVLADPAYGRHGAGPKFRVVYEADGGPEGYAIYRIKDDWDHRGPRSTMEIREAVATTPRAHRELWRVLVDVDLVRTVKAQRVPVPTPLQHVLAEPRALGLVVNDGLWVRLVDLPQALAARRYGTADQLVFEVADAACPWNAGRWQLRTSGDAGQAQAKVLRTDAPAELTLDTADLAAIYLGGVRPSELAAVGRVDAPSPGAIGRADRLFASERAPWCVMMF